MNTKIKNYLYYETESIEIDRGEGIYLYDTNNNKYIDCSAGTFNLSLGYSNKEILNSVKKQLNKLIHCSSSFAHNAILDLAEKLISLCPSNLKKVHPKVCGGSTANEGAIKIAQYHTKKKDVISFFRSHLGQTMMTLSYSGNSFRKECFHNLTPGHICVPDPYCYRCFYKQKPETCNMLCVERIYDYVKHAGRGQTACLIMEPISGNGGNIVPPYQFFKSIKKLCDELNIVLIFDEIQTGIGRTGKMFAAQFFDVSPNIITIAKGLGGTGFQIAAILTEESLSDLPGFQHSFTYGANILSAVAALKTLEIISKPEFLLNVDIVGRYILERLDKMKENHKFIGDVRGIGLMIGFEIINPDGSENPKTTKMIIEYGKKQGLLLRSSQYGFGNVIKIRPALNITMSEAEELCDRLEDILIDIK